MVVKLCVLSIHAKYHLYFGLENTTFLLCSMTFFLSTKPPIQSERAVGNILTLHFLITLALPAPDGVSCLSLPLLSCPTVSQHSGVITNHLGTSASSPNSESDNHALLDEKEDSYFSEIRNFIANSEMNQASALADKR